MSRRTPARPTAQKRHRTKATTGVVTRAPRITDTPTDDGEYFTIVGKRYRWMRSESGELTAVPAPLNRPQIVTHANGAVEFTTRAGRKIDLTAALKSATPEAPTRVEYADAAAATAAGAPASVVKQAAEYDALVRKAMDRTGQTRAEVLAAFNVVEPLR